MLFVSPELGLESIRNTGLNILDMLKVLPPIFLLIGLFDVWVPRETLMPLMGEKSGLKGALLAFALGSFTAGPLYAAFPVAAILMKKGARYANVLIFIGAWSSTKLPLMLFESTSLGGTFTLVRLVVNLIGIPFIAFFIEYFIDHKEKQKVYDLHQNAA